MTRIVISFLSAFALTTAAHAQSGCSSDISGDGQVNGVDLSIVLSQWGLGRGAASDINRDDIVDGVDLAAVLGTWGACPN